MYRPRTNPASLHISPNTLSMCIYALLSSPSPRPNLPRSRSQQSAHTHAGGHALVKGHERGDEFVALCEVIGYMTNVGDEAPVEIISGSMGCCFICASTWDSRDGRSSAAGWTRSCWTTRSAVKEFYAWWPMRRARAPPALGARYSCLQGVP